MVMSGAEEWKDAQDVSPKPLTLRVALPTSRGSVFSAEAEERVRHLKVSPGGSPGLERRLALPRAVAYSCASCAGLEVPGQG